MKHFSLFRILIFIGMLITCLLSIILSFLFINFSINTIFITSTGTLSLERSNDRITTDQFRKDTSGLVSSKLSGNM